MEKHFSSSWCRLMFFFSMHSEGQVPRATIPLSILLRKVFLSFQFPVTNVSIATVVVGTIAININDSNRNFFSTQFKSIICSHLKLMKWLYEVENEISFSFNFKSSVKMLVYQFVQPTNDWLGTFVRKHDLLFAFDKSRRSFYRLKWNWIFFPIWTFLCSRSYLLLRKQSSCEWWKCENHLHLIWKKKASVGSHR